METSIVLLVSLLWLFFIANSKFSLGDGDANSYMGCNHREREALLSFRQGLKDPSNLLSSWSSGEDCCKTWKGVHCDNTTGHVIRLHLSYNVEGSKFGGTISPSLLELKYLNYLDLSDNDFSGIPIPAFLGSIHNLRYLNLSRANFGGKIPTSLGNLSSLHYLDLNHPEFIELDVENLQWLSRLSSLRYLDMSQVNLNKVSDDWVQVINTLPSLSELHLYHCGLYEIHSLSYVNFTSLSVLDLSGNYFGGHSIPNWLFTLSGLVSLNLDGNNFEGPIPGALQNLTNLRSLHLSNNSFNSTIPDWLYNFSSLEFLDLSYNINLLQGTISADIGNLTSITSLYLSYCNLEGGIPTTLGHLCNLRTLSLSRNKLKGEISVFLNTLSQCIAGSLEALDLSENQFSGSLLPDQLLGQFKNLHYLSLEYNSFSGPIPKSLGSLSKLDHLHISNNSFEGVMSEIHFANLTRLEQLSMDSTSLILNVSSDWIPPFQIKYLYMRSGKLATQLFPEWLRTQKEIISLDLSDTGISDTIPTWFWNLSSQFFLLNLSHNHIKGNLPNFLYSNASDASIFLQSNHFEGPLPHVSSNIAELDLSNNSLSGPISGFLCNSTTINRLRLLELSENHLSGELPDCWMYWPRLIMINLGSNRLTGKVPSSMGSLLVLRSLHLRNNGLSGELPVSLENCTQLITVDLGENAFSGDIPRWMGKSLPDLLVLRLRSNKFNGSIPLQLCHLTSLQMLDLAHNNLSGNIPQCFGNLSAMATLQNSTRPFSYSGYHGLYIEKALLVMKGMQLEYGNTLTLVTSMDLSSNSLSGKIPVQLTNLLGLRFLNLSENCLTGKIPEKIDVISLLESLDFSVNKLSGVIPQSMANLNFLAHLNLSNNSFSGKIPSSTQLQSFSESSYIGNQELCGPPLKVNCTQSKDPNEGDGVQEDKDDSTLFDMESFYISMATGIVVGFWIVFGVLVFKKAWRFAYFRFIDDVTDKLCTLF